ncbi:hypothetical protein [Erythrobacter sp.]|uniref:hypothetical protein n=1 Tax=Erythrobacter sp. TaxID=1042 RepID=UPI0025FE9F08|nr:hypothetical protein [Erythrobacter sp.]
MISFLPDLSAASGSAPSLPRQAGARSERGSATLDFAGLLDAALPAEEMLSPDAASPVALPGLPVAEPVEPAALPMPPGTALLPDPAGEAPLPPGTIPPQTGTALPPSGADVPPAPIIPQTAAAPQLPPRGAPALHNGADAVTVGGGASAPQPGTAVLLAMAAPLAPPDNLASGPAAVPAPVPAALPAGLRSTTATRALAASLEPIVDDAPEGSASSALLADSAEPALPFAPSSTPTQQPAANALGQPTPVGPISPSAERAELRTPAPQVESAIAQVGDIREALRAARPEMTLRHAEFGMISLRIEATGAAQDWRAVLASRDPGFVPAVQTALAERAVTASAETASTGTGANSGQGSAASEQRYGSSPGSGQGSSQPYLAQSGQRDEGASQHQRHQQHRADEAASAGGPDSDRPDHRERGLFA